MIPAPRVGPPFLDYYVRIWEQERENPTYYWISVVKEPPVRVPDYVGFDPGVYQWSVSPIVKDGVLDYEDVGRFTMP